MWPVRVAEERRQGDRGSDSHGGRSVRSPWAGGPGWRCWDASVCLHCLSLPLGAQPSAPGRRMAVSAQSSATLSETRGRAKRPGWCFRNEAGCGRVWFVSNRKLMSSEVPSPRCGTCLRLSEKASLPAPRTPLFAGAFSSVFPVGSSPPRCAPRREVVRKGS